MERRALDLVDARDPRVERIWRSLAAHTRPSYFLSWGWIENWLEALPVDESPALALIHDRGEPTAAFFLAQRKLRRNFVMQSNALFFNATGSPRHAGVGIEHNGLLTVPGARRSLSGVLDLLPGDWDELHLPALDRYAFDDLGAPSSPLTARYKVRIERDELAPFVDLEAVRTVDGGYDALLPANTRTQLQRARSLLGGVDIEVAMDARQAMDIYGELLRLHARRWASRGLCGAFADPWVERFHRRLILRRLAHGEIQLVRVRAGKTTLGCLYNLVYRRRVMFYEAGVSSFADSHIDPGTICQAAAVEYNALAGHSTYDLLGGSAAFKESLATGANRLVWLRVQRRIAPLASVEDNVRRWYDMLVGNREQLALRPA